MDIKIVYLFAMMIMYNIIVYNNEETTFRISFKVSNHKAQYFTDISTRMQIQCNS